MEAPLNVEIHVAPVRQVASLLRKKRGVKEEKMFNRAPLVPLEIGP